MSGTEATASLSGGPYVHYFMLRILIGVLVQLGWLVYFYQILYSTGASKRRIERGLRSWSLVVVQLGIIHLSLLIASSVSRAERRGKEKKEPNEGRNGGLLLIALL